MARPTKYTKALLAKAAQYLTEYKESGEDAIPQVAALADYLNIARSTIYEWSKEEGKEEFSDIVERILCNQERTLINKGLLGEFNASITKLALTKHGYSEKQDVAVSGDGIIFNMNFNPKEGKD